MLVTTYQLTQDDKKKVGRLAKMSFAAMVLVFLVELSIGILAAYLAWQCSAGMGDVGRFFMSVLAFIFSGLYILYYVVAHVLLGKKC